MRMGLWLACLAFSAALLSGKADAAISGARPAVGLTMTDNVQLATFRARPYPSGYAGWRHCRKHRVIVETPTGPRRRWVCI